jgi:uncharacterized protein (TIGR02118 family)
VSVWKVGYKSGVRFDEQYYLSTHIPLAATYFSKFGIKDVEVVRFHETGGQPPVYQVIITAHFDSMAGLQQAMSHPDFEQVLADVPNYYDGVPDVLIGEALTLPV